ncbi:FAD binding domain-containing protein [Leadbettera azotonutricia]|uniref:FAD binding domain in molybdopterin dehydrogenase protein n=1 Tax=Leadbettera azotonutricia (strain ATCC BAA-888 / DSM 13862 / ZAS-9) TaxID=545695 RepID=F5YAW5_LEAAZ|nr:FAD binding domain-containing protein [Leadbettera azotonutricia]AEF83144.1 FAD binding domain in molybdopterin dehydrogenase protein [Leadbettera azotonutricia ZAS-9]
MDAVPNQVFFPESFQELFGFWGRFPDAVPFAGGTDLIRNQVKRVPVLPKNILCLEKMADLKRITRTERYLEMGAMVGISEIINLGKIVPPILAKTLSGISGPALRNIATIGGNICHKERRLDATAPMIALDAHYELRTSSTARWISASRFSSLPGPPALAPQELLTRIRIPLDQWNYSVYRKFKSPGSNESGGVIVLILKTQKDTLTDLRIVYSGNLIMQDRNSEARLIGKQLPLDRKEALSFLESWKHYLQAMQEVAESIKNGISKPQIDLLKAQISNFIENAILEIAD